MKEFWIHPGLHKTGTTAIQNALKRFSKEIEKQGFFSIVLQIDLPKIHAFFNPDFYGNTTLPDPNAVKKEFLGYLESVNFDKIIISCEDLTSGYRSWSNSADKISYLLKDIAKSIHLLIYIRRQDRIYESMYSEEYVKNSFDKRTRFKDLCASINSSPYNNNLDWYSKIVDYKNRLSAQDSQVILYENIKKDDDIFQNFCAKIGIKLSTKMTSNLANRSLSLSEIYILQNTPIISKSEWFPFLNRLSQKNLDLEKNTQNRLMPYFFSKEEREKIIKYYHLSNAKLFSEFGLGDENDLENWEEIKKAEPIYLDIESSDNQALNALSHALKLLTHILFNEKSFSWDLRSAKIQGNKILLPYQRFAGSGWLDELRQLENKLVLRGWAIDKKNHRGCAIVICASSEQALASTVSNLSRPDVKNHFELIDDKVGFELTVDPCPKKAYRLLAVTYSGSVFEISSSKINTLSEENFPDNESENEDHSAQLIHEYEHRISLLSKENFDLRNLISEKNTNKITANEEASQSFDIGANKKLAANEEALHQCNALLKNRSSDIRFLAQLFEALQQDVRAIFDSLTWRLGFAMAKIIRWLTFSKRISLVEDHVAQLTKTYQFWRQTTANLDIISKKATEPSLSTLASPTPEMQSASPSKFTDGDRCSKRESND